MGSCLSYFIGSDYVQLPVVTFNRQGAGPKVQATSFSVKGHGTALSSVPIEQGKCYFEIKVLKPGNIHVGVSQAGKPKQLSEHLGSESNPNSWAVDLSNVEREIKAGDVIGVRVDQDATLQVLYSLNGSDRPTWTQNGVKGTVYAAVSVSGGAQIEATFSEGLFEHEPAAGFEAILISRDMM